MPCHHRRVSSPDRPFQLRSLVIGDDPDAWMAAGFSVVDGLTMAYQFHPRWTARGPEGELPVREREGLLQSMKVALTNVFLQSTVLQILL